MNCPKCKCPNPPGAGFCQMCYEPFNRSAAENYVRNVRRQRYEDERKLQKNSTGAQSASFVRALIEILNDIDWAGIASKFWELAVRFKKQLGIAAAIGAGLIVLLILQAPEVRFRALGHPLRYAFKANKGCGYLVGFATEFKSWSEWNRQLDTPMEQFSVDEIGNITLERVSTSGDGTTVGLRPKEWIRIRHDADRTDSRQISMTDPSILPLTIQLDSHGRLAQRPTAQSSRLGRALNLVMPMTPEKSLRLGDHWTEPVEWVELISDWKIYWAGNVDWVMERAEDCPGGACVRLTCKTNLHPQIWGSPAWAAGALGHPVFDATPATGGAVFDVKRHRLVANNLTFNTTMRVPIRDLGRIPWELRVGRRVRGVPGDILLQFKERLDVHEN